MTRFIYARGDPLSSSPMKVTYHGQQKGERRVFFTDATIHLVKPAIQLSDVSDRWVRLTVTASSGEQKYYVDGVLKGSTHCQLQSSLRWIGGVGPISSRRWGLLGRLRVYDKALTATEVQELIEGNSGGDGCIFESDPESFELASGLGKTTAQFPSSSSGAKAVDGSTENTGSEVCTLTDSSNSEDSWWRVDLGPGFGYVVSSVSITSRADCCGERLSNIDILVGNGDSPEDNPVCARSASVPMGQTKTFDCAMIGRYVMIKQNLRNVPLSLCEISVKGYVPRGYYLSSGKVSSCPVGHFCDGRKQKALSSGSIWLTAPGEMSSLRRPVQERLSLSTWQHKREG